MEYLKTIFNNEQFSSAIFKTLIFILIGFILSRFNIVDKKEQKGIMNALTKFCVPCLAFDAFMSEFDKNQLINGLLILGVSVLIYLIGIGLGNLIFIKREKNDRLVNSMFFVLGQVTFLGLPMAKTMYPDALQDVLIPGNMVTLSFRFFLYVVAFSVISSTTKEKKSPGKIVSNIVLNPIVIMMILGLIIWVTQNVAPKVTVNHEQYSIFRLDKTCMPFYLIVSTASSCTTPFALLSIGMILGTNPLKEAAKDKEAWSVSILRSFVYPLITLIVIVILKFNNLYLMSEATAATLMIMAAAPLSAVLCTFCNKYNNHKDLAARVSVLSTLECIVFIPLFIIVIKLIYMV